MSNEIKKDLRKAWNLHLESTHDQFAQEEIRFTTMLNQIFDDTETKIIMTDINRCAHVFYDEPEKDLLGVIIDYLVTAINAPITNERRKARIYQVINIIIDSCNKNEPTTDGEDKT